MLNLVKTIEEDGKIVKVTVKVLKDGSCLLFRETAFVRKYKDLTKCLNENAMFEFLKEGIDDEHEY